MELQACMPAPEGLDDAASAHAPSNSKSKPPVTENSASHAHITVLPEEHPGEPLDRDKNSSQLLAGRQRGSASIRSSLNDRRLEGLLAAQRGRSVRIKATGTSSQGLAHCCAWWNPKDTLQVVKAAAKKDPKVIWVPTLLCLICTALGVWGVLAASDNEHDNRWEMATNRASDKAQTIASELRATYLPVKVLQSFISRTSNFSVLTGIFPSLAGELISLTSAGSISSLQLSPHGIVAAIYPEKGNERALNHNLLADKQNRDFAYKTIASGDLTLAGPYMLVQGFMGAPARFPIFVSGVDANEDFGVDNPNADLMTPDKCPRCYDPVTRTMFWGFATVMIDWTAFIQKVVAINDLKGQGYDYSLTRHDDQNPDVEMVLAGANKTLHKPICVDIRVPNNVWTLHVVDERGWVPNWTWPLVAMVVLLSIILNLLLGALMVSRVTQNQLLKDMLSINCQMEEAAGVLLEEKQRMEALLARHYDLIACLEGNTGTNSMLGAVVGHGSFTGKMDVMRRKLFSGDGNGNSSMAQLPSARLLDVRSQVTLQELLGEGTFGKVYKGLWRGSEVAVKTIILPANMSGKEKRAKMALMEGAISTTLAHPNIVATYTYHIRPLKDSAGSDRNERASQDITASAIIVGDSQAGSGCSPVEADPLQVFKDDVDDIARRGLHSYEVQLVIEFCDKGDLRTALDAGIFFGGAGLNYAAILETAADVAKAMLHLHANNVLHGDLKADNIMLKSCGGEGRGVMAKVADFGLAIQMDHLKTHVSKAFQGTMTHMAPEVMLQGQVSKAADVYAFGVTLWELFTSGQPYQGVPGVLLGHQTSKEGRRPTFPLGTPSGLRELAERCWHQDMAQRPSFDEILETLQQLRAELPQPTPTLASYQIPPPQPAPKPALPRLSSAAANGSIRQPSLLRGRPPSLGGLGSRQGSLQGIPRPLSPGGLNSSAGSTTLGRSPLGMPQVLPPPPPAASAPDPASPRPPPQDAAAASAATLSIAVDAQAPPAGGPASPLALAPAAVGPASVGQAPVRKKSKKKKRDVVIQVGGRNVGLNAAINSTAIVLEPISESGLSDTEEHAREF